MNREAELAHYLEKHMVPYDEWATCGADPEAVRMAQEGTDEGYPIALAKHPIMGFFVIASGQGPYVAWPDDEEIHKRRKAAEKLKSVQQQFDSAGDYRDWDACNRLEDERDALVLDAQGKRDFYLDVKIGGTD